MSVEPFPSDFVKITRHQPHHHTATGAPYVVRVQLGAVVVEAPCHDLVSAWTIRDDALDAGYQARIIGLPMLGAACGFPVRTSPLPEVED